MTSSVDSNGDMNKQPIKWASRPTSISMSVSPSKPPRMVDRELQRIKSLAMVSGISRSFAQEPQSITIVSSGPSPTPSVSSSTSYHHHHRPTTMSSFPDMRFGSSARSHRSNSASSYHSRSGATAIHVSSSSSSASSRNLRRLKQAELDEIERELIEMFEDAYRTQHQDRVEHWVSTVALPPPSDSCSELSNGGGGQDEQQQPQRQQQQEQEQEREQQQPLSSSVGSEGSNNKNSRPRRDSVISMDVESMTTTITTTRDQHQQQRIKELKSQYAAAVRRAEHAEQQHAQWARHVQEILSAQLSEKEAEARKARQLAELVVYQEQMIAAMQRDLERRDDIQELQRTREAVNQLWVAIDTLTGTKKGIQHAMHKVQHEQDASRHVLVQMQDALREVAAEVEVQRTQIAEKIEAMRRQLEEKEQEGHHHHHRSCGCSCRHHHHHDDDRMSIMSTGRAPRTARYTGGPLPPAAPPPTDPLPPLPVSSSSIPDNAPPSVYSSSSIITHDNASSVLFDDHHSERAYREFAEQLQTRLSVSKEIDDLHLWQSEDLEEFERRMHEKFKDIDVDKRQSFIHSLRSKEGATFWRGMKKKLRV